MPRLLLAGVLIAIVLLIYALIDLTVTDDARIRKLNRILWIVIIVLLPIVGPLAWILVGKGPRSAARVVAPDDDPSFGSSRPTISDAEADRRIRDIEAQLRALEAEEEAERSRAKPEAQSEESDRKPEAGEGRDDGA